MPGLFILAEGGGSGGNVDASLLARILDNR